MNVLSYASIILTIVIYNNCLEGPLWQLVARRKHSLSVGRGRRAERVGLETFGGSGGMVGQEDLSVFHRMTFSGGRAGSSRNNVHLCFLSKQNTHLSGPCYPAETRDGRNRDGLPCLHNGMLAFCGVPARREQVITIP